MEPTETIGQNIIYGLLDPRNGELRYVGKSTSGFRRVRNHTAVSNLKPSTKKNNWIKSLLSQGLAPKGVVLEECSNRDSLPELEKLAIAHYRSQGFDLLNHTDGGEGTCGRVMPEESRKRIAEAMGSRVISDETRKRMSEGQRGRVRTDMDLEVIEKLKKSRIGKKNSDTHTQAISESNRARVWTEESKSKLAETNKRLGKKPPHPSTFSEETKAKMVESQKHRPPVSEETRARLSERTKAYWERKKSSSLTKED